MQAIHDGWQLAKSLAFVSPVDEFDPGLRERKTRASSAAGTTDRSRYAKTGCDSSGTPRPLLAAFTLIFVRASAAIDSGATPLQVAPLVWILALLTVLVLTVIACSEKRWGANRILGDLAIAGTAPAVVRALP